MEAMEERVMEALEERVARKVAARWHAARKEAKTKDKEEMEEKTGPEYGSFNQDAIVNCLEKMAIFSEWAENATEEHGFEHLKESVQDILIVLEEWTKEAEKMDVDPNMCSPTIQAQALVRATTNFLTREGARPRSEDQPPLSEIIKAAKDHLQRHRWRSCQGLQISEGDCCRD